MRKLVFILFMIFSFGAYADICPTEMAEQKIVEYIESMPGQVKNINVGSLIEITDKYNTSDSAGFKQEITTVYYSFEWKTPQSDNFLPMVGNAVLFSGSCQYIVEGSTAVGKVESGPATNRSPEKSRDHRTIVDFDISPGVKSSNNGVIIVSFDRPRVDGFRLTYDRTSWHLFCGAVASLNRVKKMSPLSVVKGMTLWGDSRGIENQVIESGIVYSLKTFNAPAKKANYVRSIKCIEG